MYQNDREFYMHGCLQYAHVLIHHENIQKSSGCRMPSVMIQLQLGLALHITNGW